MKKIPCFFKIDHAKHAAVNEVNPNAEFIFQHPEAVPTVKKDGTALMFSEEGKWFIRRAVKKNKKTPAGFIAVETDPNTNTTFGWEPVENSGFFKIFQEAVAQMEFSPEAGTFELCAPKIQNNAEQLTKPTIFKHGAITVENFPTISEIAAHRDDVMGFLKPYFEKFKEDHIEGVVWWIGDTPSVKMRVKDFFPEMDSRFSK